MTLSAVDCVAQDDKRRSAGYYYRTSEVQLGKHNWSAARQSLNDCLQEDPTYWDAYYSRAIVNEHFDSLNQALTDYNIYLEYNPEHHEAIFGRAQVRMRLEQNYLAKTDLLKLLSLPPGPTTAVFFRQDAYTGSVDQVFTAKGANKSYLYNALGLVTMKLNDYDGAIGYFDSALVLSPNDPDVFVNRGTARERKADTTEAINDFRRALMYNPQHAVAKHNLSAISKGKNITERDPGLLDEAIEDNPKMPFAYAERAYMNFQKGNFSKAVDDYTHAINLDTSQPEYLLNRGLAYEKLKNTDAAYADYTAALRLQNDFDKAWLNRGNLLARIGKLNEAVDDYTVAITHSPDYASAFFNRAMVLNRLKKRDMACADLQTAERLGVKVEPRAWKSICGK
jgi:tetratricopeptide (TPR) repeat protein